MTDIIVWLVVIFLVAPRILWREQTPQERWDCAAHALLHEGRTHEEIYELLGERPTHAQ